MVIIGDAVTGAGYERSYLYDGWADRGPDSDSGNTDSDETATTDDGADTTETTQ
jgi:precorrin-4 C11-methyltransferase (EC 2.1.1.133)